MDIPALRRWLASSHTVLVDAVADGVREHVAALRAGGVEFYGYSLLPGEPYDINGLTAATNGDADLEVAPGDDQYRYYRYSVDEWSRYDSDGFATANTLLTEANARFAALHSKDEDAFEMDEFELAHADALLDAVVRGLAVARDTGAFGANAPFLVVWIPDSGHPILVESARRLNPAPVADEFAAEFG